MFLFLSGGGYICPAAIFSHEETLLSSLSQDLVEKQIFLTELLRGCIGLMDELRYNSSARDVWMPVLFPQRTSK